MAIELRHIMDALDERYPAELAESFDNVGLHFGSKTNKVKKVLVALDVRPNIVEEAILNQVDTIIVHHPPIFNPIRKFNLENPQINMYAKIIQHQINIFALHTNLDKAENGMNDWLAQALDLTDIKGFSEDEPIGEQLGRIGKLKAPLEREAIFNFIKERLKTNHLTVIEKEAKESYETIALVGGSGSEFAELGCKQGADIYLTGDITFHNGQDCYEMDMMTIDVGHYVEAIFIDKMAALLEDLNIKNEWNLEIVASQENTNPFTYI